jgi:prenyl protein peptidase
MSILLLNTIICNGNKHIELTYYQAIGYCTILAVSYVASLYILVPIEIRKLHRDDPKQIRWRSCTLSIICIIAMISYRYIFCVSLSVHYDFVNSQKLKSTIISTFVAIVGVLFHTTILYSGVFMTNFLLIYETIWRQDGRVLLSRLMQQIYIVNIYPISQSLIFNVNMKRWIILRYLVIAPITEEIVFRSCMVPVLSSTGMKTFNVCLVAPLFFGVAHVHHALLKLQQGVDIMQVTLVTLFQFLYTCMFGAYASYTYLRTGSLFAVVTCHSMCNAMGLPDIAFLRKDSILYQYRWLLVSSLASGIIGFFIGIATFNLPLTIIAQS